MRDIWDHRFFTLAELVSTWSKDPNKRVGAAIISENKRKISFGYNGFPAKIADNARLQHKDLKNSLSVHAELNAILNASHNLAGSTLYCTNAVCDKCALALISAGIVAVVMPRVNPASSWAHSCNLALALFEEAKITVTFIETSQ